MKLPNVSPNAKAYLEAFYSGPKIQHLSAEDARHMFSLAPPPPINIEVPPVASVEDRQVGVSNDEEVTVRIYTPEGEGPFPLFVYYHGGGWVIGDLETSDAGCRLIAEQTKRVVVSVNYRLAPQYKFPVPVEDCYTALLWVQEHADEFNANAKDIVVGGDSAGGNLATVMSILTHERSGPAITAQALIYPVTNLHYDTDSYKKYADGYGLDRDLMIWFGNYYINDNEDTNNPHVSPLLYENLSVLPPTLIIAAENDVLRDEGVAYLQKLQEAGVETSYKIVEGSIHGYFSNMIVFGEETKQTVKEIGEFIKRIPSSLTSK